MSTSSIFAPSTIEPQRGRPAAPTWFQRATAAVGSALRAAAAAQARREMLAFAERCEGLQPQLAAELRAASARLTAR